MHLFIWPTCLCCNLISNCSCKLTTSKRVAGVVETCCRHFCPSSSHSFGGKIVLSISSVSLRASAASGADFARVGEPPLCSSYYHGGGQLKRISEKSVFTCVENFSSCFVTKTGLSYFTSVLPDGKIRSAI